MYCCIPSNTIFPMYRMMKRGPTPIMTSNRFWYNICFTFFTPVFDNHFLMVPQIGLEPIRYFVPTDFLTTLVSYCSLDYAFICSRCRPSSLYTFHIKIWLSSALPLIKVSPNLSEFTLDFPI